MNNNSTISSDNLYLVFNLNKEYHGLYEDDHCYFTYLNVETREFVEDYWTTAGACPAFQSYWRPSVETAIENNLISADDVRKLFIEHYVNGLRSFYADQWYKYMNPYVKGIRVEGAKRSRLFKGHGYLIDFYKHDVSFGWRTGSEIRAHVLSDDGTIVSATLNTLCMEGTSMPIWEAIISEISKFDVTEYAKSITTDEFFTYFYEANSYYMLYDTSAYSRWNWSQSQLYINTVAYILRNAFHIDDEILSKIYDALYDNHVKSIKSHNEYVEKQRNGLYNWMKQNLKDLDSEELESRFKRSCVNKGYVVEELPEYEKFIEDYKYDNEKHLNEYK